MSFAKPAPKKQESEFDEVQRLMCSVSGCNRKWSVDMGRPMCSQHQWGKEKPALKNLTTESPKEVEVPQWWNKDAF